MARKRNGEKRERILQAATKVFAKNGFYATRVSEIAKAAGVADGTIYLYFENKDHVLVSIFEDRISRLLRILEEVADRNEGPFERLKKIIELQLGLLEEQRDLAEVITVNLRQSSKLLKQYATPLFVRYLQVVGAVVAQGQQQGVIRADVHPMVVSRSLWGALDGLALTWALSPDREPTPERLRTAAGQFADFFLAGLRVAAPHGER